MRAFVHCLTFMSSFEWYCRFVFAILWFDSLISATDGSILVIRVDHAAELKGT